ncbi:asparagine synthase, partial [Cystoisospora suis]
MSSPFRVTLHYKRPRHRAAAPPSTPHVDPPAAPPRSCSPSCFSFSSTTSSPVGSPRYFCVSQPCCSPSILVHVESSAVWLCQGNPARISCLVTSSRSRRTENPAVRRALDPLPRRPRSQSVTRKESDSSPFLSGHCSSRVHPASSPSTSASPLAPSPTSAVSLSSSPSRHSSLSPHALCSASDEDNSCRSPRTPPVILQETGSSTASVTHAPELTTERERETLANFSERGKDVTEKSFSDQYNEVANNGRVPRGSSSLSPPFSSVDPSGDLPDVLVFDGDIFAIQEGSNEGDDVEDDVGREEEEAAAALEAGDFPGDNEYIKGQSEGFRDCRATRFLRHLTEKLHLCDSEEEIVRILDMLGRPDQFDQVLRRNSGHSRSLLSDARDHDYAVNPALSLNHCTLYSREKGCEEHQKVDGISEIPLPCVNFSLVFFSSKLQTLFFCRDKCGARSLLIGSYTLASCTHTAEDPRDFITTHVNNAETEGTCSHTSPAWGCGRSGNLCFSGDVLQSRGEKEVHNFKNSRLGGTGEEGDKIPGEGQQRDDMPTTGIFAFIVQGDPSNECGSDSSGDGSSTDGISPGKIHDLSRRAEPLIEISSSTLSQEFRMQTTLEGRRSLFPVPGTIGENSPLGSKCVSGPSLVGQVPQCSVNTRGHSEYLATSRQHDTAVPSVEAPVEKAITAHRSTCICEEVPVTGIAALSLPRLLRCLGAFPSRRDKSYDVAGVPLDRRGSLDRTSKAASENVLDSQDVWSKSVSAGAQSGSSHLKDGSNKSLFCDAQSPSLSFPPSVLSFLLWPRPSVLTSEHFWCTSPVCQLCISRREGYWRGRFSNAKEPRALDNCLTSASRAESSSKQSPALRPSSDKEKSNSVAAQGKERVNQVLALASDALQLTREDVTKELLRWLEESVVRCCADLECEPRQQGTGPPGENQESSQLKLGSTTYVENGEADFVAVLFSGGVDSSLIAALVCRLAKQGRLLRGGASQESSCLGYDRKGAEPLATKRNASRHRKRRKLVVELVNVAFEPMAPDRLTGLASYGDLLDLVAKLQPSNNREKEKASIPRRQPAAGLLAERTENESSAEVPKAESGDTSPSGEEKRDSVNDAKRKEREEREENCGDGVFPGCSPVDECTPEDADLEVRFVAVDVSEADAVNAQKEILQLAAPHGTHMDLNISSALFFAMRGQGYLVSPSFRSHPEWLALLQKKDIWAPLCVQRVTRRNQHLREPTGEPEVQTEAPCVEEGQEHGVNHAREREVANTEACCGESSGAGEDDEKDGPRNTKASVPEEKGKRPFAKCILCRLKAKPGCSHGACKLCCRKLRLIAIEEASLGEQSGEPRGMSPAPASASEGSRTAGGFVESKEPISTARHLSVVADSSPPGGEAKEGKDSGRTSTEAPDERGEAVGRQDSVRARVVHLNGQGMVELPKSLRLRPACSVHPFRETTGGAKVHLEGALKKMNVRARQVPGAMAESADRESEEQRKRDACFGSPPRPPAGPEETFDYQTCPAPGEQGEREGIDMAEASGSAGAAYSFGGCSDIPWYAARVKSNVVQKGPETQEGAVQRYSVRSGVVLVGSGADELFGGYGRHKTARVKRGPEGMRQEVLLDLRRIWQRNLGRDSRICCHLSRASRLPFLDQNLLAFVGFAVPFEMVVEGPQSVIIPVPAFSRAERCRELALPSASVTEGVKRATEMGGRQRPTRNGGSGIARRDAEEQEANGGARSHAAATGPPHDAAVSLTSTSSGSLLRSSSTSYPARLDQFCSTLSTCSASSSPLHSCNAVSV